MTQPVHQLDILAIIMSSGIVVQAVLGLLLLASIISWGIIFFKWRQFKQIESENILFWQKYNETTNLKEIATYAKDESQSPFSNLYLGGYNAIAKLKTKFSGDEGAHQLSEYFQDQGLISVERGIKQGVAEVSLYFESNLSFLASIGSVTPFIGLFGTVWGIIHSFTGLASGSATLAAVAPGIAEALVATAVGLFAAIPAVWFYNMFSNKITAVNTELERFSNDFLNLIERSLIAPKDRG
jgi:biopolymer transport protein TolQ